MRSVFLLVTMPLLFDAGVAACLGGGRTSALPPATDSAPGYEVFFDWDQVELSATGRRIVAAAAHAARHRDITRIEVLGLADEAAGAEYMAAVTLARARRVRAELLRDGLNATDIGVLGAGISWSAPRRVELVLQGTS